MYFINIVIQSPNSLISIGVNLHKNQLVYSVPHRQLRSNPLRWKTEKRPISFLKVKLQYLTIGPNFYFVFPTAFITILFKKKKTLKLEKCTLESQFWNILISKNKNCEHRLRVHVFLYIFWYKRNQIIEYTKHTTCIYIHVMLYMHVLCTPTSIWMCYP